MFRNKKAVFIFIGVLTIFFFLIIFYWSFLPRTATLDIPGEGIYTGQLRGMTFHGYGTYESYELKGTSYEGEWENGYFHGHGTLTFANGTKLTGDFVEGNIQGIGYRICPDGHITEINFSEWNHASGSSCCDH